MRSSFFVATLAATAMASIIAPASASELGAVQISIIDDSHKQVDWSVLPSTSLKIINQPVDNETSPVETSAQIARSNTHLYLRFVAKDTDQTKIVGILSPRDSILYDDSVGIKIDPNKTDSGFYEFSVSAAGVQSDAKYTEQARDYDYSWDATWSSQAIKTDDGYEVVMSIPFSELNYSEDLSDWGIELVRTYPREELYKISHIKSDRDNSCKTCQLLNTSGFELKNSDSKLKITPGITLSNNKNTPVPGGKFDSNNKTDLSLDVKWNINSDTVFSGTVNPDFSAIESDAGQISVNRQFALYYDEKRDFFLENSDVFSSEMPILYTRNIIQPNYGAKISSASGKHQYGMFVVDDDFTSFIEADEIGSKFIEVEGESTNAAASYNYKPNEELSLGGAATARKGDDYSNEVVLLNASYRPSNSDRLVFTAAKTDQSLYGDHKSDNGYIAVWYHDSENWSTKLKREDIGIDFRADLGYMDDIGVQEDSAYIERIEYVSDSFITRVMPFLSLSNKEDESGYKFYEKRNVGLTLEGNSQFYLSVAYFDNEDVGLRFNENSRDIKGNVTNYDLKYSDLYFGMQPTSNARISLEAYYGDAIDYYNDEKGTKKAFAPGIELDVNDQLSLSANFSYEKLSSNKGSGYKTSLYDLRLAYQYSVYSRFQISVVYDDTTFYEKDSRNDDDYSKNLGLQALYVYEDPSTHSFYAGYSDSRIDEPSIKKLEKVEQSVFVKYAYNFDL